MTRDSETQPPLVSVLVPSFNHEKYVLAALDSVVLQDYPRVELIVIDDGSQDRSYENIQRHHQRHDRTIERYSIDCAANSGAQATLDSAIRKSSGQYILMLASDDELVGHAVTDLVAQLERHPEVSVCVPDSCFIDSNGDVTQLLGYDSVFAYQTRNNNMVNNGCLSRFGFYETFLYGNYIPNGVLFRREVLAAIEDFRDMPYPEDYAIWLRVSKVTRMVFLPKKLFRYRIHDSNSITVQPDRIRVGLFEQLMAEREFAVSHGYAQDWSNSLISHCVRFFLERRFRLGLKGLVCAGPRMTLSAVSSKIFGKLIARDKNS